jgi:drug/metabolite transporter (DMT)-like permease
MSNRQIESTALIELILASALWGFGFIATSWVLREVSPLTLTGLRMSLAFAFGFLLILIVPSLRRQLSMSQFRLAFWPGIFLSVTMFLQTLGLKSTTVTKSGFITTLYVLIVPVMERFLLGRRIPKYHMLYVLGALIGVGFICDLGRMGAADSSLTIGDWITLACSFAAALQIVWFGKIADRIENSFHFNVYQLFWTGIVPFIAMFIFESPSLKHLSLWPTIGFIELIFGSSLIAFALQVRAQKKLSPSVSSLVYLLESPFAAIFSFALLSEPMTTKTLIGAAIIMASLVASIVFSQEARSVQ